MKIVKKHYESVKFDDGSEYDRYPGGAWVWYDYITETECICGEQKSKELEEFYQKEKMKDE